MKAHTFSSIIANGEAYPLHYADIMAITRGDVNLVEFHTLTEYSDYKELFAKNPRIGMFWETESATVGHFDCLLYKNENGAESIEFFDSYGFSIDKVFDFSEYDKRLFNNNNPLRTLIADAINQGVKFKYNTVKFQSYANQIATCGRYAALRLRFYDLSLEQFQAFLQEGTKRAHRNYDELVTSMTILFSDIQLFI